MRTWRAPPSPPPSPPPPPPAARRYLVEAFSGAKPEQNQRIFESLEKVQLVFGLSTSEAQAVHNEIGSLVYRQYTNKALQQKGDLGKDEFQFLASIKDALGMEQALCDELIRDQKTMRISVLVEQMFEKDQVLADDVRTMRDAAELYEVDLVEDLQVSDFKRERLFVCELEDLIDTGVLTVADLSPVEELCESLVVSEERASAMLEQTVQKRVSGGVLQAASFLKQSSHDAATTELSRIIKYGSLLDVVADAPFVTPKERNELYMLFQASLLSGKAEVGNKDEALAKLKALMGLGTEAAATSA